MPSPDDPAIPTAISEAFGLSGSAFLGGRLNKHWRVQRGTETLVLRRWAGEQADILYERTLRGRVAELGWPVSCDVSDVFWHEGAGWSLATWLAGEPMARDDLRTRGRLLAEFHQSVQGLGTLQQRGTWRRCEEILTDEQLPRTFAAHPVPEEATLYLWHLERAQALAAELPLAERPSQPVHGDFTAWNVLLNGGKLSGLLDFELAHLDHRVADFALSWRGQYDDLIHAYHEVSPLDDVEWALLTPMWWAFLLEQAHTDLRRGVRDDGWVLRMLQRRSPLMRV